ncbi:MAG: NBR1-Ig-like domain-containing protein [Anaerolineales bacterium]|nr:NBR1-Ig-like domain-containing protein [Anaerolineales bacterium]
MAANNHWKQVLVLGIVSLMIGLAACGPSSVLGGALDPGAEGPTPAVSEEPLARVREVEIRILESYPAQVEVVAKGYLPNSCLVLGDVVKERQASTFQVVLFTKAEEGRDCTQAVFPFERVIPLDVLGLEAGRYTVDVNGIEGQFEFLADNEPQAANASVEGRLWHDLCAVSGGQGGVPVQALPGCVATGQETYRANGVMEAGEPAIGGALINLGLGACPSTGLATAVTGDDGGYRFTELEAGTYCVSIDPLAAQNVSVLVPGDWTFPMPGSALGGHTVNLPPGEAHLNINFGWDYQNQPAPPPLPTPTVAPTPTPRPTPCDWAGFVQDVAVKDGSVFNPGAKFTKVWRLKNMGTCTWTTDYDLVFAGGDQMGGLAAIPLSGSVRPGETVDLSVNLTAPDKAGKFRGYWQLRNARGVLFGTGDDANSRFWADILVEDLPYRAFYNFADAICDARWQGGAGSLPCSGTQDDPAGFVIRLENPALENRRENEPALWVRPNVDGASWIEGIYPVFEVKEGDRFKAWVGCMEGSTDCKVQFELGYFKRNGNYKVIGTWRESYDGKVTIINQDLSALAGQQLQFVLKMTRLNDQAGAANGFWFVPSIQRIARNIK